MFKFVADRKGASEFPRFETVHLTTPLSQARNTNDVIASVEEEDQPE